MYLVLPSRCIRESEFIMCNEGIRDSSVDSQAARTVVSDYLRKASTFLNLQKQKLLQSTPSSLLLMGAGGT